MKKLIAWTGALMFIGLPIAAMAASGDDILGRWLTEGKDTIIEVYKRDGLYYGKIASLEYPNYTDGAMAGRPKLDDNNPEESKRSRPLVGTEIISGFRYEGGKWTGGEIYDPESGKTYSCEITLAPSGLLEVRGYIAISLIGRTTAWERPEAYLQRKLKLIGMDCACKKTR